MEKYVYVHTWEKKKILSEFAAKCRTNSPQVWTTLWGMWLLGDSECVQQNVSQGCKHDSAAGLSSDQIIFLTLQTPTPLPLPSPSSPISLKKKKVKHNQTICWLSPTNFFSVFNHFLGLDLRSFTFTIKKVASTTKVAKFLF